MSLKYLILILVLGTNKLPKRFYYESNVCSVSHTTIQKWDLDLRDGGSFVLQYSFRDTRFPKASGDTIIGEWKASNDTLHLTQKTKTNMFFHGATYVLKNETLKKIGLDAFLPDSMLVR
jgi:hypothetical protein